MISDPLAALGLISHIDNSYVVVCVCASPGRAALRGRVAHDIETAGLYGAPSGAVTKVDAIQID